MYFFVDILVSYYVIDLMIISVWIDNLLDKEYEIVNGYFVVECVYYFNIGY